MLIVGVAETDRHGLMQRYSIEGERPSLADPPLSLHLEVRSFRMDGTGSVPHGWAAGSWVRKVKLMLASLTHWAQGASPRSE